MNSVLQDIDNMKVVVVPDGEKGGVWHLAHRVRHLAKVKPVVLLNSLVASKPQSRGRDTATPPCNLPLPFLMGVWLELRDGVPVVHALLEDGAEIPARWISAFNLDGYPTPWVEAQGVRYFLRKPKTRLSAEVVAAAAP